MTDIESRVVFHPESHRLSGHSLIQASAWQTAMDMVRPLAHWDAQIKGRRYLRLHAERYGNPQLRYPDKAAIHLGVYCHNMGELRASAVLMKLIRERHPDWRMTLLSKAFEPLESWQKVCPVFDGAVLGPLNAPRYAIRAFRALHLDALVTIESDLRTWWNISAKRLGMATAWLGGVWSPREARRHRNPWIYHDLAMHMDLLSVRNEIDAQSIIAFGAPSERIHVTGNLRYDAAFQMPPASDELRQAVQTAAAGRPVVTAGSTYAEEEQALVSFLNRMHDSQLAALLVVAPRNPERSSEVARWFREQGWTVSMRSVPEPADVLVLDTMGELSALFALSTAAFIGGTLTPRGGHNAIEAAAASIPVVYGPSIESASDVFERLTESGGGASVTNADTLAEQLVYWLNHPEACRTAGVAARRALEPLRHASERCIDLLDALMASRQRAIGQRTD